MMHPVVRNLYAVRQIIELPETDDCPLNALLQWNVVDNKNALNALFCSLFRFYVAKDVNLLCSVFCFTLYVPTAVTMLTAHF
jgi:hypothetical protein